MRLAVILVFAGVVCGLVYAVFTHSNVERLDELQTQLETLQAQNEQLRDDNEDLERQVMALRDDPRLAERRARESVGLARPSELIFQFDESRDQPPIVVRLVVESDELRLAGEPVEPEQLPAGLERLADQIEEPRLEVQVCEQVGPVERQRIVELVEESVLGDDARIEVAGHEH